MSRILFFAPKTGGGHVSLAQGLSDLLSPTYETKIVDPQLSVVSLGYRIVSRHLLSAWESGFHFVNNPQLARLVHLVGLLQTLAMRREIAGYKPDLIISTHPFCSYELKLAQRLTQIRAPLIFQLSDPVVTHAVWFTEKNVQVVFAPTQEVYRDVKNKFSSSTQVLLTGWPVRQQFLKKYDGSEKFNTIRSTGLSHDQPIVFLQGGAEGSANYESTLDLLMRIKNVQVILAVGTNTLIKDKVRKNNWLSRVYCLKFTTDPSRYMFAADIVMGKAGPNFLFEAISLGKPFVATTFIPGQEEANLQLISNHDLGWVATSDREQNQLFSSLFKSNMQLINLKRTAVRSYSDENAKRLAKIPEFIDVLLNNYKELGRRKWF